MLATKAEPRYEGGPCDGTMAERLRTGLQIRVPRFDSGWYLAGVLFKIQCFKSSSGSLSADLNRFRPSVRDVFSMIKSAI